MATVGAIFGLSGMTHGFAETLQGNTPTGGLFINTVAAGSRWTRWSEGGEGTFTIVPNFLSDSTVREENGWFPMTAQKLAAEAVVHQSGVPSTIFCPTWPMEQLPPLVAGGRATLGGDRPLAWRWFAAADVGRLVANTYQPVPSSVGTLGAYLSFASLLPWALFSVLVARRLFQPGQGRQQERYGIANRKSPKEDLS